MNKTYTLLIYILITTTLAAQPPQAFTYQLIARNTNGSLAISKSVSFRISLLEDNASGTLAYAETHSITTSERGEANLTIGTGAPVTNTFADIDWPNHPHYLKVELDPDGGTSYTHLRTIEILSVPYALHAENVEVTKLGDNGGVEITNCTTCDADHEGVMRYNKYIKQMQVCDGTIWISTGSTVKDIDGNTYNTVTIGTQVWMAENLKTTKYNDGTAITLETVAVAWANQTTEAYCWHNNDEATYKDLYGALYNWYAVDATSNGGKNICPDGWHVPNDAEWTILRDYLGGESVAGGKLKEAGLANWNSPNTGATNESGFTALPGGYRLYSSGSFYGGGYYGYWWSSTEYDSSSAWFRTLYYNNSNFGRYHYGKRDGFSVRCLRD